MDDKNLRAAIYARVSSEQQAQQCTITSQVADLRERILADGLSLEEELSFVDDGHSGSTLARPALERLRDVAYAGGIDRVYVHSPDRLARKYAYQVLLVDEFQHHGVELVFLNHALGDTPEEDLLLQMQGMIAEYERAKIMERSRRGKRHAARRGSVNVLSGAPYGYRYISKQEGNGEAHYRIVFEEARIVKQIFEWVGQDGLSIGEVCRRLKKQGVLTRTGKNYWDRTTVWGMLKNPAYKGSAGFGKTRTGPRKAALRPQRGREQSRRAYSTYSTSSEEQEVIPVPAIVSEELFEAVGEQLAENKKRNRQQKRGARYLLQGLLACKCCGYAYYGKPVSRSAAKGKKRRYAYYRCIGTDAYRFGGERLCYNKQVRTDLLESAVWEDVCSLLNNPGRIQEEYERRLKDQATSRTVETEQLSRMIQKVKRGIARLIDAYEDGLLSKDEFEPRIHSAKERLRKLEAEAKAEADRQAQQAELKLLIGRFEDFAEQVREGLQDPEWATRREIIRALVKRVEIGEEDVRVIYKVSPAPFVEGPASGACLQDCWRRDHRALRRAYRCLRPFAFFADPGSKPLADQTENTTIADAMLQKLDQPLVVDRVEEAFDIGIQYPVHPLARDRNAQCIECIVLAAATAEAVAEPEKVLLVDALQYPQHRLLDDLVLQRSDAERSLAAVRFGYPDPSRRLSPVGSPVNATMEVRNVGLQVPLVFAPCYAVDANRRRLLQMEEGFGQAVFVDVMQQGRELELAVLSGSFAHTVQSARLAFGPARRPAQGVLLGVPLG